MNNNKETNALSDSESDDRNRINEDVNRTQHDSNRKANMNTSVKLPKRNHIIVYHNPDSNLWDKALAIGRARKATGQNKHWFNIKDT